MSQFLSKSLHANRSLSHANRVSGRAFPARRETVFGCQRQKATNCLRAVLPPCRDWKPTYSPPQNRGYSANARKSRLAQECVVVDAAPIEPVSSLHFGQMQGDFRKMQGGPRHKLAKSHQISIAWNGVSLLKRAGKSRENHLCPAGWRFRLRPDTGDCPLEPVAASNLQHLHFSECQLEPWETRMGLRTWVR